VSRRLQTDSYRYSRLQQLSITTPFRVLLCVTSLLEVSNSSRTAVAILSGTRPIESALTVCVFRYIISSQLPTGRRSVRPIVPLRHCFTDGRALQCCVNVSSYSSASLSLYRSVQFCRLYSSTHLIKVEFGGAAGHLAARRPAAPCHSPT